MQTQESLNTLRGCGYVRYATCALQSPDLEQALISLGLRPPEVSLTAISRETARLIVERAFTRDLAYGVRLMQPKAAADVAAHLLASHSNPKSGYYTNLDPDDFLNADDLSSWTCTPLTEATFDAGVIIQTDSSYTCVWVEDED